MNEPERLTREIMAMIVTRDLFDGAIVNLGVGLPLECANFLSSDKEILLHSELGLLGFGSVVNDYREADPYLTMVGGVPVTAQPGMSFMSHDESFALIRGGHIDVAVLGGLQVDQEGNLANTQLIGKPAGNLGGAQDLAYGAKKTVVLMYHTTSRKEKKILERCTLPLTTPRCVDRIVTDVAVIDVESQGLVLREVAPGWNAEMVQSITGANLIIDSELKEIEL